MPPRGGSRSTRSTRSAASSKSATTLKAAAAASRASPAIDVPPEAPDNALRTQMCAIFRDAQRNTASHRKLAVKLRKLQERACYKSEDDEEARKDEEAYNEQSFTTEFARCVLRVMPVRKAESAGEKTIRFIGLFMRHASDKDNELAGEVDDDASLMPETPMTRLTNRLLETVLPLMTAKDKYVRYRATQLISHVINSLDAIDDDIFQKLRHGLLKRIRDKEAMVRAQAVLGLGRLAGQIDGCTNSDESEDDAATGLLEKLLGVLQNDPSADVRRSLLVNLPILPNTLPYLLERARDQDAATRRAVYSRLLPALGDFRHLSLSMREKLLRWGLRDRDENVRKAAYRLFRERWIEDCAGNGQEGNQEGNKEGKEGKEGQEGQEGSQDKEQEQKEKGPNPEALLELLERIDVINSGVENGIALEAMRGFWEGRPDYRDSITFDNRFWETLSAESVFIVRSFNEFCRNEANGKYERLVDEKLPEVTTLAYYIERYIQALIETIKRIKRQERNHDDDENEEEEDTVEQEFIVEQLLHIALTLDYSDEVGRRKMFALLRQALSIPELPDEVTKLSINVLRDVCGPDIAGEKEFCSVVLESVADVHDTVADDPPPDAEDSFHSAQSDVSEPDTSTTKEKKRKGGPESEEEAQEKAIKEIVVNMKCLHIVRCMLTNVSGNLQQNDHLVSMLNNLVVPAVRSHEAPVRERGLVCLGLCSLLDKSLAEENLTLFVHFFAKGHTALQITALHIITDILNVHGAQLIQSNPALLKVYIKALRLGARSPEVQVAATVAVSKLLLGRVITDPEASQELLKSLIIAYFDPSSAENQSVRQALNYFLPVFCYSRAENQDLMRAVAIDTLHALFNIREGLEDEDADVGEVMDSPSKIGACLVDWTDPRKVYTPGITAETEKRVINGDIHLQFALDILARLHGSISKEEKKVVAGLLGKLYISAGSSAEKIREVYAEVCEAVEDGLISDTTGKNALYKVHVNLGKIVNTLDTQEATNRRTSRSVSVVSNVDERERASNSAGRTIVHDVKIKEEPEDDDEPSGEGTVIQGGRRDSLVEDSEGEA